MSCCAPTQPDLRHFGEQLQSILGQRGVDLTVSVLDDGSSTTILEGIRAAAVDARVSVTTGPRLGVFHNFERGLRLVPAGVDVVLLSDQDDVWCADKAATLAEELARDERRPARAQRRPGHRRRGASARGLPVRGRGARRASPRHGPPDPQERRHRLYGRIPPDPARQRTAVPPLGPNPPFHHDLWLALCAAAVGRVQTHDEPLQDYRQHTRQRGRARAGAQPVGVPLASGAGLAAAAARGELSRRCGRPGPAAGRRPGCGREAVGGRRGWTSSAAPLDGLATLRGPAGVVRPPARPGRSWWSAPRWPAAGVLPLCRQGHRGAPPGPAARTRRGSAGA